MSADTSMDAYPIEVEFPDISVYAQSTSGGPICAHV
ncbi:hypothetical protein OKW35_000577 [Paraburkholderia sp. MM5477-R1]